MTTITTVAICFMGGGSGIMVNTHHTKAMTIRRTSNDMSVLIMFYLTTKIFPVCTFSKDQLSSN